MVGSHSWGSPFFLKPKTRFDSGTAVLTPGTELLEKSLLFSRGVCEVKRCEMGFNSNAPERTISFTNLEIATLLFAN
jgi:hypothetical protein